PIALAAYAYPTSVLCLSTHPDASFSTSINSPALRIPTVQARRAAVHDDERLGVALVAEGGGRGEAGAVAGDGDVFGGAWGGGGAGRACARSAPFCPSGIFPRGGGGSGDGGAYF